MEDLEHQCKCKSQLDIFSSYPRESKGRIEPLAVWESEEVDEEAVQKIETIEEKEPDWAIFGMTFVGS